jgi:hypothetical protein
MADTTSDLAALGVPLRQTVSPSTACHWAAGSVLGPPCVVTYERRRLLMDLLVFEVGLKEMQIVYGTATVPARPG